MPAPYECAECRDSGVRVLSCDEEDASPIGYLRDGKWKQSHERIPVVSEVARMKFGNSVAGNPLVLRRRGFGPMRIELCPCVRRALRKYL